MLHCTSRLEFSKILVESWCLMLIHQIDGLRLMSLDGRDHILKCKASTARTDRSI
jgi:hypothetical protein